MQTVDFIQALPKAELHLHLEGAIDWALAQELSPEPLPDHPPWWADDFRYDDFTHFSQVMRLHYRSVLNSVENYGRAAQWLFNQLVAQNVRYVETSFGPGIALTHQLPLADVVSAIKQAAPPTLSVCVYFGLARTELYDHDHPKLQAMFATPNIDGLDLHGDETVHGPAPFAPIFAHARELGWQIKAHAGELVGPHSICEALDTLHVTRIEHGTTAMHDEALQERLTAEGITLDMCPTSNVKLRVVERIESHPIRRFLQRGIRVTVNTDDPSAFGCTLTSELHTLVERLNFTLPELAQLQVNAFNVAKMPTAKRESIINEIETLTEGLGKK
jgi:adenosine deaminase